MQNRRLIDIRQPSEFASGHIEGAELVPLRRLSSMCEAWHREEPITLICLSGHRAQMAHRQLRCKGFTDVEVLPGGMQRWRAAGKPTQALPQTKAQVAARWAFRVGVVAASIVLARLVSPWILVVPAFLAVRWISQR